MTAMSMPAPGATSCLAPERGMRESVEGRARIGPR